MQVTEAISKFLEDNGRFQIYHPRLEVQVNVKHSDKKIQKEKYYLWTDGKESWKPIRIPYSDGSYKDPQLYFSTDKFEKIGLSGWNWRDKVSEWVGFDFDSVVNHNRSGLSHETLLKIQEEVKRIPWVTIRKSTSGNGFHLYVFLKNPPTVNSRKEHKQLAKAILDLMIGRVSISLQSKVDCYGMILWVWSRHSGKKGFELVKQGVPLSLIPENWRDSIPVNKGIKEISRSVTRVPLSGDHLKLLEWMQANGEYWHWNEDKHLLVTHTSSLLKAHKALNLPGPFETLAEGKEGVDWNCFMYPMSIGWVVRRFTQGTEEEITWGKDTGGWTRCFYACPCNFCDCLPDINGVVPVQRHLHLSYTGQSI